MSTFLHRLKPHNIRLELAGGLTTAVVSLPMAFTFGVASGAGPEAGFFGAFIVGLFAALFGSSKTLISEPTGPMTVVMTAVIARYMAADPTTGLATAFTVVILAGLVQMLFGALKLGRYITMMPYSVVSGFMSGIGVLLILTQLPGLLGAANPGGGALGIIGGLGTLVQGAQPLELALGIGALVLLFAYPAKLKKYLPPQLLTLVLGIGAAAVFLSGEVQVVGQFSIGLPTITLPQFSASLLGSMVVDALVLGILASIDTLLTAMISDSLTREQHDSNRELMGQGLANTLAGLFGGLPGAGATMGTVVNIQSGARSPLASIIRVGVLFLVTVVISPILSFIPMAVLAAIAIKVGFDILDWSFLGRAHKISRNSTILMYGVLLLTVLVDLMVAVGVGVFVANILTIERLSQVQSTKVRTIDPSGDPVMTNDQERKLLERLGDSVILFHLSGPMIFGVAQAISRETQSLDPSAKSLIIDLSEVSILGTTVALALENVVNDALDRSLVVSIVTHGGSVLDKVKRFPMGEQVHLFSSRIESLEWTATLLHKPEPVTLYGS